jgi:glyoxylase I family protein
MLDLVEWRTPRVPKGPATDLARPGFGRVCLKLSDCDAMHAELAAAGYRPYSPPTRLTLAGSDIKVFCVEDPDGVVVEFMEFLPQSPPIA